MGLFEDIIVNAKAAANAFGKKASEVVDISKLKINAADISSEISKKYEALGKMVYDSNKSGDVGYSFVKENVDEIDYLYNKLKDINDQVSVLKNKIKCMECGFNNKSDSMYCAGCGAKIKSVKIYCECDLDCSDKADFEEMDQDNCGCTGSVCDEDCDCGCKDEKEQDKKPKQRESKLDKSDIDDNCDCGCEEETK